MDCSASQKRKKRNVLLTTQLPPLIALQVFYGHSGKEKANMPFSGGDNHRFALQNLLSPRYPNVQNFFPSPLRLAWHFEFILAMAMEEIRVWCFSAIKIYWFGAQYLCYKQEADFPVSVTTSQKRAIATYNKIYHPKNKAWSSIFLTLQKKI